MRLPFSLFLLIFSSILLAVPLRFDFRDALRRNTIDITMDGALERTVGVSHFVTGWIEIDPDAVSKNLKGELEVDMRTFETGTELKNIFLREKVFETALYPTAHATFLKVVSTSTGRFADGGGPIHMKVESQLQFKNTSRNVILPLKISYYKENEFTRLRLSGNLLAVTSGFEMDLTTFGITLPEAIRASVAKSVQVNAAFVGSNHPPTGVDVVLPDGPKPKETSKK